MNFPTAYLHARKRHPIARAEWGTVAATETEPVNSGTKWLTLEGDAWFFHDEPNGKTLVNSSDPPNLSAEDLLADDWLLPPSCDDVVAALQESPDFPTNNTDNIEPPFDVVNPPCVV